jgi:hypothetical protein
MTDNSNSVSIYSKVVDLLNSARKHVAYSVNQTMVYTYYLIGGMIVEEEQHGEDRAKYGSQLIKGLSKKLSKEFGKGFSQRNIEQMRQFYTVYSKAQAVSADSGESKAQAVSAEFTKSNIYR